MRMRLAMADVAGADAKQAHQATLRRQLKPENRQQKSGSQQAQQGGKTASMVSARTRRQSCNAPSTSLLAQTDIGLASIALSGICMAHNTGFSK